MYADKGCALCSIMSRESHRDGDENMDSFFEICPTPATGLTSEIQWFTDRKNGSGRPIYQLSFYFFAEPGKLLPQTVDIIR